MVEFWFKLAVSKFRKRKLEGKILLCNRQEIEEKE